MPRRVHRVCATTHRCAESCTNATCVLDRANARRYKATNGSRANRSAPNPHRATSASGTSPYIDQGAGFVNKSEMIDAIARHADISKAAAGRALEATVAAIKTSLKKGDIVTLVGFGSFYVGRRNSRAGRNPRTGDAIKIEAAKVPKFRAGKALKDELN
jgi:DNA-binding protein HU-beta